ncbi:hypothetical protein HC023_33025, partial [Streptomyces sp. NEAU-H3]|nr:hypothetical protein [Streptomyces sp. NEAU-H3]
VDGGGLGAGGSVPLGARAGQVYGAVGDAFLDGMRLCLTISAALTFIAAVLAFVLLRPRADRAGRVVRESAAQAPAGREAAGEGAHA